MPTETGGPSCPTRCIAVWTAGLNCPATGVRNFTVYPPDPHRFDGDHDGVGCER